MTEPQLSPQDIEQTSIGWKILYSTSPQSTAPSRTTVVGTIYAPAAFTLSGIPVDEAEAPADVELAVPFVELAMVDVAIVELLAEFAPAPEDTVEVDVALALTTLEVAVADEVPELAMEELAIEELDPAALLETVLKKLDALPVGLAVEAAIVVEGAPMVICDVLYATVVSVSRTK